jgi:hypothetical protein
VSQKYIAQGDEIAVPHRFPALSSINREVFMDRIAGAPYGQLLEEGIGLESR